MSHVRQETFSQLAWLLLIGAWSAGLAFGRWAGGSETLFSCLGGALGPPLPESQLWWEPFLYFPLTVVAAFVVSELLFGALAPVFVFSRGVWDSVVLSSLEKTLQGMDITSTTGGQIWVLFYYILVFVGNLPLCLWASHLGVSRSFRALQRLYGKAIRPEKGLVGSLMVLLAISVILGLLGAFAVSYAA